MNDKPQHRRVQEDQLRVVAQLVEHRSPKPAVGGSSPSGPAGLWESFPGPTHVNANGEFEKKVIEWS